MSRAREQAAPAALRLTYSAESNALYVALAEGEVAETREIEELVYVDVDIQGRPLGIEFVAADDLLQFLQRHGGEFVVPERVGARLPVTA